MSGLYQIIQFATESWINLLVTVVVIMAFGISLSIPVSELKLYRSPKFIFKEKDDDK